jgi:putative protease
MSPAGYWPQLEAAVAAGADSVYFGLQHFTARAKVGFQLAELPAVMRTLHRHGVRGFVTFNTLVFQHEFREAARALGGIAEAGADAVIVQDLGALRLARQIAPELEIHGSTQMSITDAHGVRMAAGLGVDRVTLARELSLEEIGKIRAASAVDLEIFVHGALCVAYSGQCFSSEAWGGRSANRGQCAQACRLPYRLMVDGEHRPLADTRYLLSPGDLYALHHVPAIVATGISALKIEGRYKDAEYVALVTRAYRQAVDETCSGLPLTVKAADELRLEQAYSRGLGDYFMSGTDHQRVVSGRSPRHRGVLMGRVVSVTGEQVTIEAGAAADTSPIKPGDGVVFDAASWRSPEEPEEGGRIFEVHKAAGRRRLQLSFGNKAIDPRRIRPGDLVWRTHDPALDREARQIVSQRRKQRVDVTIRAHEGAPLWSEWRLDRISVIVEGTAPLGSAETRSLDQTVAREQLARLGKTPYELGSFTLETEGNVFVPVSALNALRRLAAEQLQARQEAGSALRVLNPSVCVEKLLQRAAQAPQPDGERARLHVLVRTPEQLDAALGLSPASVTLDYLDLYGLKPSVEHTKATGIDVRVASPRVLKPGEERIIDFLLRLDCPILVRSTGLLAALRDWEHPPLTGDFSLNAANSVAADELLQQGLLRIAPTYDLNGAQVTELARLVGGDRLEAIAYSHLPVFHTEHCVFCRFLSTGHSYKDCGRPCEKHRVALQDASGREHPVVADVGCRNTIFGAEAQEASRHLQAWLKAGIRDYRLEFVHENAEAVVAVGAVFRDALDGRLQPAQLAAKLRQISSSGTTEGSLFVAPGYDLLPILQ